MMKRLLVAALLFPAALSAWAEAKGAPLETAAFGLNWGQDSQALRDRKVVLTAVPMKALDRVFQAENLPKPPSVAERVILHFGPGDRLYGIAAMGGDLPPPAMSARERVDMLKRELSRKHGPPLDPDESVPPAMSLGGPPMKALEVYRFRDAERFATVTFTVLNTGAEMWSLSITHLGLYREMFEP